MEALWNVGVRKGRVHREASCAEASQKRTEKHQRGGEHQPEAGDASSSQMFPSTQEECHQRDTLASWSLTSPPQAGR